MNFCTVRYATGFVTKSLRGRSKDKSVTQDYDFCFIAKRTSDGFFGRVFLPFAVARTIIENLVAHTCRIKRPDNLFLLQDRHVRSFFPMRHSAFSLSERFGGPHSGRFWLRICILEGSHVSSSRNAGP